MNRPDILPEDFKPKLLAGRILPKGRNFIYKDLKSSKQVELPLSMADLVLMCDGNHTIQQILTKIFNKQKVVQFQKILDTLFLLHKKGLLTNSGHMDQAQDLSSRQMELFTLIPKNSTPISDGFRSFVLIFILIMNAVLMGSSIFFGSIKIDLGSTKIGLTDLALGGVSALFLLNVRSLAYFFLSSLFLSLPSALSFRLGTRGFGFASDLEGMSSEFDLRQKLWFYFGYLTFPSGLTLMALPYFSGGTGFFDRTLFISFGSLFLFDLFPHFRGSVGKCLLRELERVPSSSDLTDFGSFLQKSSQRFELGRSMAGVAWCFFALCFLGIVMEGFGSGSNMGASVILGAGFVFIIFYAHQSLRGVWENRDPSKKSNRPAEGQDLNRALDLLESVSLFSEIGDNHLKALVEGSELLSIPQGTIIFSEGDLPHDIYLLVSGRCEVRNNHLTAEINCGSIFGESALLDSGLRLATVVAQSPVVVLKISVQKLSEMLSRTGHLESLKSQIVVNQYFCSSKHFLKIRRSTIEKLERSGHLETVGAGTLIFKQGDAADGLYFLVRGSVEAEVSSKNRIHMKQGEVFGEISVLARIPRTATVKTLEPCLLFKVATDSFWEVLLADLHFAYQIEKLSENRLSQDLEALLSLEKVG